LAGAGGFEPPNGGIKIRWVVAPTGMITIAHAAFYAVVANWPQYPFKLRKVILVIREYSPQQAKRYRETKKRQIFPVVL
jgi:hypothetical protein